MTLWEGEVYALCAKLGAVVNLSKTEVVIRDPALRGGHNLIIRADGTAVVNATRYCSIRCYDLGSGRLKRKIDVISFPEIRRLYRRYALGYRVRRMLIRLGWGSHIPPRPLFLRGMSFAGDTLFVGISPTSILSFDWRRGELLEMFTYSRDIRECVHGLTVSP